MRKIIFFISITLLSLCGCGNTNKSVSKNEPCDSIMNIKYAQGFEIKYYKEYKEVLVNSPWKKGEIQQRYYLVKNSKIEVPNDGIKLTIPLNSILTTSCTHIEFINRINHLHSIKGVCTPNLIYNNNIQQKYKAGNIVNLGDAFNINVERVLMLKADAIMISNYNQQDESTRRLEKAGIHVIFNNEWTESTLLARAEWLKFVAVFYNKENEAIEIFDKIANSYNEYKFIAEKVEYKPTILPGGNFKGTWYVPGGQSYMGQLFKDAGANYFYKNDTTKQSIALNFETILLNFKNADVWLNAPTSDMQSLYAMDNRHGLMLAAQKDKVFAFNKRINSDGANDFWESAVTNPDLILKDIIWALHPNIMINYEPTYIINLK